MSYDAFAPRTWALAHGRSLTLGPRGLLMGVLNVTPDSFSDGGRAQTIADAVAAARAMIAAGADIIDVGGESTRPGADAVDGDTERSRVLPVLEVLAEETDAVLSIDTYRADTAEAALRAGAHIVNDVWGCQREPDIAMAAARHGAGLVVMHTDRERQVALDVIEDQLEFLHRSLEIAEGAGVARESIVVDPGIGFGKDAPRNLSILKRLGELNGLRLPIMLGTSRKRFLGTVAGREVDERDVATAATTALGRQAGVALFRVHSIGPNRDAVRIADAIRTGRIE